MTEWNRVIAHGSRGKVAGELSDVEPVARVTLLVANAPDLLHFVPHTYAPGKRTTRIKHFLRPAVPDS